MGRNLIILEKRGGLEKAVFSHWELWTGHPSPLGGVLMKRGHSKRGEGTDS